MGVQTTYQPDLNTSEIEDFLLREPFGATYDTPISTDGGFTISAASPRHLGRFSPEPPAQEIMKIRTVTHSLLISKSSNQGRQVVGNSRVASFEEYYFAVDVLMVLLVADECPEALRTSAETAFTSYGPADGDIDDYFERQLAAFPGAQRRWFKAVCHCRLTKGNVIYHNEALENLIAFYRGQGEGTITTGPNKTENAKESEYLKQQDFAVQQIGDTGEWGYHPVPVDPAYQMPSDNRPPEERLQDIADRAANALDCNSDGLTTRKFQIFSIRLDPSSRVVWRLWWVKIGCVDVGIPYPVLQFRDRKRILYGYTSYPSNLGRYIEKVIEDAFWTAVKAAGLVGIAFGDVAAATAIFRAVFLREIEDKLNQTIECAVPGLAFDEETIGDWH